MTLFTDLKEEVGILKAQWKEDHARMEKIIDDLHGLSKQLYLIIGGYTALQVIIAGVLVYTLTKGIHG